MFSRDDLRNWAVAILDRLRNGTMPRDGAWEPEKTDLFKRWAESGFQP